MSVISNLLATPNRIEIVYRFLVTYELGKIAKEDLRQVLSPPALTGSIANDVINEATRLGIIELTPDGYYHLSPELRESPSPNFLDWLEVCLLDPNRAEKIGQAKFPFALAWLLEQDPAEPFEFGDNISDIITGQCGADVEAFEMTNRARSQNFVYWAQYLGYTWRLRVGSFEGIVPDPTQAIQRHLTSLFKQTEQFLIKELLDMLATRSPVLEGGVARQKVIDLRRSDALRDPKLLSRSTSIAFLRLEERGLIKLERRADALAYTLNTKPNPRPISHVIWQRGR